MLGKTERFFKSGSWFFACFILMIVVFSGSNVRAAEKIPTPKITKINSYAWNSAEFEVRTNWKLGYAVEIYRAASSAGPYRLLDRVNYYGTTWTSYNNDGNSVYALGEKGKVQCMRNKTSHYFLDTTVRFNKKYYYKVRLSSSSAKGKFSAPKSVLIKLGMPSIRKAYVTNDNKVKLTWTYTEGAEGYLVYRRTPNGSWKRVGKVKGKNNCAFTDGTVHTGASYYYQVRAYRYYQGKAKVSASTDKYIVRLKKPVIAGNYNPGSVYGPSLTSSELSEVRRVVQSFKANYIKTGMTQKEKLAAAYNFLRFNCSYAWKGWQYNRANTAWGALVYGEAQCSGYARAMKALCDAIGVPCYYVHANAQSANPSHQWNEVQIGGKWYIVDAQGGFFMVSGKVYRNVTGMRWDSAGLPDCG